MNVYQMRKKILDLAIRGKLVLQDPNDEPASVLLQRIRKEKERLVREKKIKKEKPLPPIRAEDVPFELPNGWVWERIGNISEFVTKGTTPRGGKDVYQDSGIGFLRVENIGKNCNLLLEGMKYIDIDTHENFLKRSILSEGDLLISIAGALGRTAIVPKELLPLNLNQAISFVRWLEPSKACAEFVELAINSQKMQESLQNQARITAIPNLTLEIISTCVIPIPPLAEQKRIVAKIEELFSEVDKIEENAKSLLGLN
jgi:type I restriction enzyme S subunit